MFEILALLGVGAVLVYMSRSSSSSEPTGKKDEGIKNIDKLWSPVTILEAKDAPKLVVGQEYLASLTNLAADGFETSNPKLGDVGVHAKLLNVIDGVGLFQIVATLDPRPGYMGSLPPVASTFSAVNTQVMSLTS